MIINSSLIRHLQISNNCYLISKCSSLGSGEYWWGWGSNIRTTLITLWLKNNWTLIVLKNQEMSSISKKSRKNVPSTCWGDQRLLLLRWISQTEAEFSNQAKAIRVPKHCSFGSLGKSWTSSWTVAQRMIPTALCLGLHYLIIPQVAGNRREFDIQTSQSKWTGEKWTLVSVNIFRHFLHNKCKV